jgi:hypothetical protein
MKQCRTQDSSAAPQNDMCPMIGCAQKDKCERCSAFSYDVEDILDSTDKVCEIQEEN